MIVWTEIAGGITGAALEGSGICSLGHGAAAAVAWAGTGQGRIPLSPCWRLNQLLTALAEHSAARGRIFFQLSAV